MARENVKVARISKFPVYCCLHVFCVKTCACSQLSCAARASYLSDVAKTCSSESVYFTDSSFPFSHCLKSSTYFETSNLWLKGFLPDSLNVQRRGSGTIRSKEDTVISNSGFDNRLNYFIHVVFKLTLHSVNTVLGT